MLPALRALARARIFSASVVTIYAVGMSAVALMFSIVQGVLLRPLPYPDSDRLVVLHETWLPNYPEFTVSAANYRSWAECRDVWEASYAFRGDSVALGIPGELPEQVPVIRVTAGFTTTLRVEPLLGRGFQAEDDAPGRDKVVLLSHAFWRDRFGSRREVVGDTVLLNGEKHTVLGVMPPDFQVDSGVRAWLPLALDESAWAKRGPRGLRVVARLALGISVAHAQERLSALAAELAVQFPVTNEGWGARVVRWRDYLTESIHRPLWVLLAAVGGLLLLATANVAGLVLVRATSRQREFALRAALGAGRAQLNRQVLGETLLLAVAGCGLGLVLAHGGLYGILTLLPANFPRRSEVELDAWAIAVGAGATILAGVSCAFFPVWRATRASVAGMLKVGSGATGDGLGRDRLRRGLVFLQSALACALLILAGLLWRSLAQLLAVHPGFEPTNAVALTLMPAPARYATPESRRQLVTALHEQLASLPGVEASGAGHVVPFMGRNHVTSIWLEGAPVLPASEAPPVDYYAVTPGYFAAMGMRILQGRDFGGIDGPNGPPVVIISRECARRFFPEGAALGRRITVDVGGVRWREVVGIVDDVKHIDLEREMAPQVYEPLDQQTFPSFTFVVRSHQPDSLNASTLRTAVATCDPALPIARLSKLDEAITRSSARQRFIAALGRLFSALALLLALVGVAGAVSYSVVRRAPEYSLRVALGASPARVRRQVIWEGATPALAGMVLGLASPLLASSWIDSMLFRTQAADPLVFAAVAGSMTIMILLSCVLPAERAARCDPLQVLRSL